ncbi:hypothetical protein NIA69_00110 [Gemmiger formicilis]|nr:hypothetical protein [Gemmiger formicilis]
MNTANYEFYVLNEEKVNVDKLLAMEAEERNAVLAEAANWTECAKTTDNAADVTTNDLGDATGRIFKLNVSRTDTILGCLRPHLRGRTVRYGQAHRACCGQDHSESADQAGFRPGGRRLHDHQLGSVCNCAGRSAEHLCR